MSRSKTDDILGGPESPSAEEAARLLRLARCLLRGAEVFEDAAAAIDWLRSRNRALGGVTPLSLLGTDAGAERVIDVLGRIEHGVPS